MKDTCLPLALVLGSVPEDKILWLREELVKAGYSREEITGWDGHGEGEGLLRNRVLFGEVLVSECYVEYRGSMGYGMILGDSTSRAFILASYDLAEDDPRLKDLKALMDDWILENSKYYLDLVRDENRLFRSTKVRFEIMDQGL